MKVLLTDGSSLAARQAAVQLAAAGHWMEAVDANLNCLCRFTGHVGRIHRVPRFGRDPLGWLDATLSVYEAGRFDAVLPTHEQAAVLASAPNSLHRAGVITAVAPFAAVRALQDKLAAFQTLRHVGLPQPASAVHTAGWDRFPAYVKTPIGTASGGVQVVASHRELDRYAAGDEPVLVQQACRGRLVMCQSVFDRGALVAFHANLRTREALRGGASHKLSIEIPDVMAWMQQLGGHLRWHGALSADVILTEEGPLFIDINPRLVEPANAWRSGVDLVDELLRVAHGAPGAGQPLGRPGVATHQLLLAVLGAAHADRPRRAILRELLHATRRVGGYRDSQEELTPLRGDWMGVAPVVVAAAAGVVWPVAARKLVAQAVDSYCLTPQAWAQIQRSAACEPVHGDRHCGATGETDECAG